ncbi:MAG TPA: DUF3891 family protein [Herpetosiphonaceae bacterium]
MFKSKQRPIAIAQSEHQKLAGTLALLWGNTAFDRPAVPRMSLLAGIGLHDRAYGLLDNLPIGELPDEEWLALTRSGFEMTWADPIADLITKMHLKRLVSYGKSPAHQTMTEQMTQAIREQLLRHNLELTTFERIDRITNLCDRIAFDFCFEEPAEGAVRIFPRNNSQDQVEVWYHIEDGTIQVDPWPFGLDSQAGYLVGYQLDGYPTVLEPTMAPYQLLRRTIA